MKEVFRSNDTGMIGLYQSILDDAQIPHFVRNLITQQTFVGGAIPALLPLPDFWPTLCVLHDEDHPEAMRLLREVREVSSPSRDEWKCMVCGESVPAHFTSCWNCRAEHVARE